MFRSLLVSHFTPRAGRLLRHCLWVTSLGLAVGACDSNGSSPLVGNEPAPASGGSHPGITGGSSYLSGGRSADGGEGEHTGGSTPTTGGRPNGTGGVGPGGEGGVMDDVSAGASGASGHEEAGWGDVVAQGVRWIGRADVGTSTRFSWSGTGFVVRFQGTGVTATLKNAEGYLFFVVVDGGVQGSFLASRGEAAYPLAAQLSPGEHVVELYRQTEGRYGDSQLQDLEVVDGELLAPPTGPDAVLELIGDSITCGYGNLGAVPCSFSFDTESHWDSYGAVAGRLLGVDVHTVAISGRGLTRNNDGTTTGTLPDVYDRVLPRDETPVWTHRVAPRVIVINLGTNDFAQGNPGVFFEEQYLAFLRRLRALHPDAFLLATLGPMMKDSNLNRARNYIQNAVLAFEADGNAGSVGFLEYPVQSNDALGCNSHPNVATHRSMAEALAAKIRQLGMY